jgi:uncharacterized protein (TIGR02145 family)
LKGYGIQNINFLREERFMKKLGFFKVLLAAVIATVIFTGCGKGKGKAGDENTFTDSRDGQVYKTVKIGSQVWMAQNLNYAPGGECLGGDKKNCAKFGRLYTWESAQEAVPQGWHLPSVEEWETLINFAGGFDEAGKKLKAKDGSWGESGGSDDYGFAALPGGAGRTGGLSHYFGSMGVSGGVWWTSSVSQEEGSDGNETVLVQMYDDYDENANSVNIAYDYKNVAFSVRLVKDAQQTDIGGVYKYEYDKDEFGTVYIYPENDNTALFYFHIEKLRIGDTDLQGRITVRDGKAAYITYCDETEDSLLFEFNGDELSVKLNLRCYPVGDGEYTFARTSSEIPQYYTDSQDKKVYFKDYPPDEEGEAENTDEMSSDSVKIFNETCLIIVPDFEYLKAKEEQFAAQEAQGDFDETGDDGFYMGNALGQFDKLGIKSAGWDIEEKHRYLSFALEGGEYYVIDLKDGERREALLYKKGKKPLDIGIGWENPVGYYLQEISTYLGMKASEVMKKAEITDAKFKDIRNGLDYDIVLIGDQVWMAQNLNYYAPQTFALCYGGSGSNCEKYGWLYDYEAAKKAVPQGWRLPAYKDYETLTEYAGGWETAGKKLKSNRGWNDNGNGSDDYEFSALPGGLCAGEGDCSGEGESGFWWLAEEFNSELAYFFVMNGKDNRVYRNYESKNKLFSVRLVLDE